MSIDLSPYREDIDGASANRTPCVVATASARGEPNVSLRGSMMVLDEQHLAYWDRVHGRQEEHLAQNPHLAILYRDPPRRVSYRFYGQATVHASGPLREEVMARVVQNELDRDPERKGVAVVVRVDLVMTLSSEVLQRREDAPPTPPRTLNLLEAMHTARAIRRFRPDPVPQALLEQVLDAAVQAPSGTNAQTWRFLVLRDPDLRRQVGELYRQGCRDVYPRERVAQETDPARRRTIRSADHLAEHMGDEPPLLVLACIDRGPGGVRGGAGSQAGAPAATGTRHNAGSSIFPAVQNLILAARALGLGACLTTLHLRREAQVKEVLGIPEHVDTYALIPLGYPATPHGPLRRRPAPEVTAYDRWTFA
jgi:nitroreductase